VEIVELESGLSNQKFEQFDGKVQK